MLSNLKTKMYSVMLKFIKDKRGVTAIEYALIAVAISSVLFIVMGTGGEDGLTAKIKEAFSGIQEGLNVQTSNASTGGTN
ncbi:Flp family type IVb pilin [Campylobacter sp. 19-13652]|uniref:Flp family type IVb pilin n=1 Tax=Campylobacter sp. 19-13652 TaxID=2840180 RepID=UPI001C783C14|nr:Flp family type IVb pilin [Campylobacter sp. 19-13652]BCX78557.1 pilin [Campylobacter sp. 19-13652]